MRFLTLGIPLLIFCVTSVAMTTFSPSDNLECHGDIGVRNNGSQAIKRILVRTENSDGDKKILKISISNKEVSDPPYSFERSYDIDQLIPLKPEDCPAGIKNCHFFIGAGENVRIFVQTEPDLVHTTMITKIDELAHWTGFSITLFSKCTIIAGHLN